MIPSDVTLLDWETIEQPGEPEYHDALTIQLMQLIEDGIVTYDNFPMPGLTEEIRQRLWEKFLLRYNWREIGILPIRRWLERLQARCREALQAAVRRCGRRCQRNARGRRMAQVARRVQHLPPDSPWWLRPRLCQQRDGQGIRDHP